MSKADSINRKIRKAYGKVGKVLGYEFEIFRPQGLDDQISTMNYIDTKPAAFSLDDKFSKSPDADKNYIYTAYFDGMLENKFDIQQGDILKREETEEVYITTVVETHKPVMAFKCNDTISVQTTTYSDPGTGFAGGDTEVADLIPCYINIKNYSGGNLGYVPGSTYGTDPYNNAEVLMWDPLKQINMGDNVIDSGGTRWSVMNVEHTPIGTKLNMEMYK